jgi:uncharacterized protein YjgD (DUF1641 family)
MDQSIVELNQKIDLLTTQVAYLTEQARIAEQSRRSVDELVEIGMPIGRELMDLASEEFTEVERYLSPDNLIRLVKKFVRHGPQFEILMDQLDSMMDLVAVGSQIIEEGVEKTTDVMEDMENKGYFAFAKSGLRLVDNVVTSFTEEDVDRLGDNIVLILNTVKDMTQPEILTFLRNMFQVAEREAEKPLDTSVLALLRQMRDPAVRRGLAMTMRVLRAIGLQAAENGNGKNNENAHEIGR